MYNEYAIDMLKNKRNTGKQKGPYFNDLSTGSKAHASPLRVCPNPL